MVLTPDQFALLMEQPKKDVVMERIRLGFMLNTGMRYPEVQQFIFKHHDHEARKIHKPKYGKHRKQRERWIMLTPRYNDSLRDVKDYMKLKDKDGLEFPVVSCYRSNLRRWFDWAGIETHDLVKEFRKTRESWLIVSGYDSILVALDQGHTNLTQLKHYLSNPFSDMDVERIREYMKGWL